MATRLIATERHLPNGITQLGLTCNLTRSPNPITLTLQPDSDERALP